MSQTASIWLVIVLAFVAANLPFLTDRRVLGILPMRAPKGLAIRLAELVVCYLLVGGLGLALEQRVGRIAPQGWEFYAITGTLFLTLAFPGFVWRYLLKHRRHG
jgi:protein-S-isoprenylcysteine O-methyltransferase Ste14